MSIDFFMKHKLVLIICVWMLGLNCAWALRCGRNLVQTGDYQYDVLHTCGEPVYVEEWEEIDVTRLRSPSRTLEIGKIKPILIEEWTYNFGRTRLMQRLRFENGVLKNIKTLSYGY